MNFDDLKLIAPILEAVKKGGYTVPTPIQCQAIPAILSGRDMIGCAQTGTGKTAAFAIPILQLLHNQQLQENTRKKIRALILTPTRELAVQIGQKFYAYGKHLTLKHAIVHGGVNQQSQVRILNQGVDILIATPGRLLDLMNQRVIDLSNVRIITLDEADRMLDMGFIADVRKIITKISPQRQSLMFSATMQGEIMKLAQSILKDPIKVSVSPESPTALNIKQEIYLVDRSKKGELLVHLLQTKAKGSTLVFTRTKSGANRVANLVNGAGIHAEAIHGNKSQGARQRALDTFKAKKTQVLVATDVASRGIDISALDNVINFEIPNVPETYVHRIGRTGRAGLSGMAISLCDWEEKRHMRNIMRLINQDIPVVEGHPFPAKMSGSDASPSQTARPPRHTHRKGPSASSSRPFRSGGSRTGDKKRWPPGRKQRFGR
ncbi:MAG: DEAD/DEAH box helicase [Candidatus Gracilibacteria bacterium]